MTDAGRGGLAFDPLTLCPSPRGTADLRYSIVFIIVFVAERVGVLARPFSPRRHERIVWGARRPTREEETL
jgi:hypothetical protein